MRRMHWWGAAAGVGALAAAAVGIPTAFAQPSNHSAKPKTVATSRVKTAPAPASRNVVVKNRNGHGHDHDHWNPHCDYPPHGRTDVAIKGQNRARRGSQIQITGVVTINGCGYEHRKAGLYKLVDFGRHRQKWVPASAPVDTDKKGVAVFTVPVYRTTSYKVLVAPQDKAGPGMSDALQVATRQHDEKSHH